MLTFVHSYYLSQNLLAVRQWEDAHLPLDGSLLAFNLLTVVAHHTILGIDLNLKRLIAELNYSEAGVRKQLKRFISQGWLELKNDKNDKRVKFIYATSRLLKILTKHQQYLTRTYIQTTHMTAVEIFADLACTRLLAILDVPEQFAPATEDFQDGQDWWNKVMAKVEHVHGSRWQCFVVRSPDGSQGRRFKRLPVPEIENLFFQPRFFAFSKSPVNKTASSAVPSGARIYNLHLFDFGRYYLEGSDERIIQHLASVFGCVQEQFDQAMVMDQAANLSKTDLNQRFDLLHLVSLQNQTHYLALERCDANLNQLNQMQKEAQHIGQLMQDLALAGAEQAEQLALVLRQHVVAQFEDFKRSFGAA
jgi:DNA-binding MarR family transcriptional regulator